MELMTYMESRSAWVAFPSVLQGLRLARASAGELLLFTDQPISDLGDMSAFAALCKVSGGAMERLGIASPYPSPSWIGILRGQGIRRFWLAVPRPGSEPLELDGAGLLEVPPDLCPALHVRSFDGRAASVCGCRFDLLLLGRREFMGQCFGCWTTCRWMTGAGVAAAGRREASQCTSSS